MVLLPRFIAMVYMYCKEGEGSSRWVLVYVQLFTTPIQLIGYIVLGFMVKGQLTDFVYLGELWT